MNFKYIVMRRKSDSYKIVKFMAPELGVLVLGRGYKWLQYFFGGKIFSSVPVYSFDELRT